jgi:CheY-like chemotaxis protein
MFPTARAGSARAAGRNSSLRDIPSLSAQRSASRRETMASIVEPRQRPKVLVVEDVALIRMTTVEMVEEIGFPTAEACDGAEALSLLQSDPEIGILLTDLGLPGMTGRQLVEEALRLNPRLKIIIASGYGSEQAADGTAAQPIHLTKPFGVEQLRRALEN